MEATITQTAIDVVSGAVQVAMIGLLGWLFTWLKSKTKSDGLKSSLELLEQTAGTTVGELQQTMVDEWKAANADGKLTSAEIQKLKDLSISLVKKRMGPAAQETIRAAGVNLEDRITAAIQAAITGMKNSSVYSVAGKIASS